MTGNKFCPAAVDRAVELIQNGATDLRVVTHREFPELTRIGLDRVVDLAWQKLAERNGDGRAA